LRLLGLEGSRWYNGGPFQYRERQMRALIRGLRWRLWLRGAPHIVLTHAPPLDVGDAADRCHRGFESFHGLVRRYAPRYLLHGHIHRRFHRPEERITRIHETLVINCYGHYVFDY
jgi:Icc-related predicted phosphoesterase